MPKAICTRPASIPAVAASAMLVAYSVTTTDMATATNMEGPEINPLVPPNTAVQMQTAMAP